MTPRTPPFRILAILLVAVLVGTTSSTSAQANGEVVGFGSDFSGNLGNGPKEGRDCKPFICYASPTSIPISGDVIAISAGEDLGLALLANGKVFSWGEETVPLGRPFPNGNEGARPGPIPSLSNVAAISTGGDHSLALLRNGTVRAWGRGSSGKLGNDDIADSLDAVAVKRLKNIVAVAAGGRHSLALDESGQVWAWGDDSWGQIGDGTATNDCNPDPNITSECRSIPVKVPGLNNAVAIDAGDTFSLAILRNGTVVAWGRDDRGQIGNGDVAAEDCFGSLPCHRAPVPVSSLRNVVSISAGRLYALAVLHNGTVWAWGDDASGQLGDGGGPAQTCPKPFAGPCQTAPVRVLGINTAISANAGRGNGTSFAILGDHTLMGWGSDNAGQLGNGRPLRGASKPVAIPNLADVAQVAGAGDDGVRTFVLIRAD